MSYRVVPYDAGRCSEIRFALENRDVEVHGDWELTPGPNYEPQLRGLIRSADAFVFLMSPESIGSPHCNKEIDYAAELKKRILPVLIKGPIDESNLRPELANPQWVRVRRDDSFEAGMDSLAAAINTDFGLTAVHTWLTQRAEEWQTRKRGRTMLLRGRDLKEATDWLPKVAANTRKFPNVTSVQQEFISESQRASSRLMWIVALLTIVLAAGLGGLAISTVVQYKAKQAAIGAKLEAETAKVRADAQARENAARADTEARIGQANRTVLVGERVVDRDPAEAIAYAFEAMKSAPVLAAQTLIQRAARQLPEFQIIQVEPRKSPDRPEVLPSNFFGVRRILFAKRGNVLVVRHENHSVTTWDASTGRSGGVLGGRAHPIVEVEVTQQDPTSIIVLYGDGTLTRSRLHERATLGPPERVRGLFTNLVPMTDRSEVRALTRAGELLAVDGIPPPVKPQSKQIFRTPTERTHFRTVAFDDTSQQLVGVTDGNWIETIDVKTGNIYRIKSYSWGDGDSTSIGIDVVKRLGMAVVAHRSELKSEVIVVDLLSQTIVTEFEREFGVSAVDRSGGKIAVLGGEKIEQWQARRENGKLQVESSGEWPIENGTSDVGEPQCIAYGPLGEYLVTVNAPSLKLVGPEPATVKLWYANAFSDSRIGDVHGGTRLSPRDVSAINCAFDGTGHRVAVFSTDGRMRIWDVTPEQLIDPALEAHDYFYKERHLSLETRKLLEITSGTPEEFLKEADGVFRVRLTAEQKSQLAAALAAPHDFQSLLNKVSERQPSSIALQTDSQRAGISQTVAGVPKGYSDTRGLYDPLLGNDALTSLVSEIQHGGVRDDDAIARRYYLALEADLLLLGGLQGNSARAAIRSDEPNTRAKGYILLALTGDISQLPLVDNVAKTEGVGSEIASVASWASKFLQTYGRDLSFHSRLLQDPSSLTVSGLYAVPTLLVGNQALATLFEVRTDSRLVDIVVRAAHDPSAFPQLPVLALAATLTSGNKAMQQLNFATLLRDGNEYDAALAWCAPLIRDPDSFKREAGRKYAGSPENLYGYILHLQGKDKDAIAHYQKSIAQGRPDGWPERNWADSLAKIGKNVEARDMYISAIKKVRALVDRAKVRAQTLDALGPEIAGFYNALAWHIVTSDLRTPADLKTAYAAAVKACDLTHNSDPNLIDTLASVEAIAGRYSLAIEKETIAVRLLPLDDPDRSSYQKKIMEWTEALKRVR